MAMDRATIIVQAPARYICFLSKRVMRRPVTICGEEGVFYDRASLMDYIERKGWRSPNSGNPITGIIGCAELEAAIDFDFWQRYQLWGSRPPQHIDLTDDSTNTARVSQAGVGVVADTAISADLMELRRTATATQASTISHLVNATAETGAADHEIAINTNTTIPTNVISKQGAAAADTAAAEIVAVTAASAGADSPGASTKRRFRLRFPASIGPFARAALLRDLESKEKEREEIARTPRPILSLAARCDEYRRLRSQPGRRALLQRDELESSPWLLPQNPCSKPIRSLPAPSTGAHVSQPPAPPPQHNQRQPLVPEQQPQQQRQPQVVQPINGESQTPATELVAPSPGRPRQQQMIREQPTQLPLQHLEMAKGTGTHVEPSLEGFMAFKLLAGRNLQPQVGTEAAAEAAAAIAPAAAQEVDATLQDTSLADLPPRTTANKEMNFDLSEGTCQKLQPQPGLTGLPTDHDVQRPLGHVQERPVGHGAQQDGRHRLPYRNMPLSPSPVLSHEPNPTQRLESGTRARKVNAECEEGCVAAVNTAGASSVQPTVDSAKSLKITNFDGVQKWLDQRFNAGASKATAVVLDLGGALVRRSRTCARVTKFTINRGGGSDSAAITIIRNGRLQGNVSVVVEGGASVAFQDLTFLTSPVRTGARQGWDAVMVVRGAGSRVSLKNCTVNVASEATQVQPQGAAAATSAGVSLYTGCVLALDGGAVELSGQCELKGGACFGLAAVGPGSIARAELARVMCAGTAGFLAALGGQLKAVKCSAQESQGDHVLKSSGSADVMGAGFAAVDGGQLFTSECVAQSCSHSGFLVAGIGTRLCSEGRCRAESNGWAGFAAMDHAMLLAGPGCVGISNAVAGYAAYSGGILRAEGRCLAKRNKGQGWLAAHTGRMEIGVQCQAVENGDGGFMTLGDAFLTAGRSCLAERNSGPGWAGLAGSQVVVEEGCRAVGNAGSGFVARAASRLVLGPQCVASMNTEEGYVALENSRIVLCSGSKATQNTKSGFTAADGGTLDAAAGSCVAEGNGQHGFCAEDRGSVLLVGPGSSALGNGGWGALVSSEAEMQLAPEGWWAQDNKKGGVGKESGWLYLARK
ncbi:hypothetical protein Vafri_4168 [Volvox africanus]|uniref:U-box domain-containing protein n=1 Tax=Volvox africanus TaxID=51714 RepID=A0A8J4AUH6_9CHLO|nr:hypothetical protein Vafri_4168 [Volvox africanus]